MTEGRQILMAMFQGGGNIPLLLPRIDSSCPFAFHFELLIVNC